MTYDTYTQSVWPGAPKFLPPMIPQAERPALYAMASDADASQALLEAVWSDVSQRVAQASDDPNFVYPPEVEE